jgi:hemolysin III
MAEQRWTLGKMQNPVRGFLHGASAVVAVFGTILLALSSPDWGIRTGAIVFGLAMVALYSTSTLYHAIPWRLKWKQRMQRLDHSMILVLIAGTYTPVAIGTLDGPSMWSVLVIAWGTVAVGVIQHSFFPREKQTFSMILAISMGWLGVFIAWTFVLKLGWLASALALIGGLIYSVGMVLLITNRPRLWPKVFSYHEVFHVLVVGGSAAHYTMAFAYIAPFVAV